MTEHDALLDRLRRAALAADPPPPELEGSARAAFGLSRLDHEMAQLLHDSAAELTGVRGGDTPQRLMSFAAGDVSADVQITEVSGVYDITGLVTGAVSTAHLQTPTDRHDLGLDAHGRFRVTDVHGPAMRLEWVTEAGYTVVTPWVTVT